MDQIQKDGYDHYMLKEIHEQPRAIRDTLRGRMFADQGKIQISSINDFKTDLLKSSASSSLPVAPRGTLDWLANI